LSWGLISCSCRALSRSRVQPEKPDETTPDPFYLFEDPLLTLIILVLLVLPQTAMAYLLEPRLAGRTLDLSPFVIILALAFWGSLWGIVGMILAVPLVVTTKAILNQVLVTRPLGRMLSNA
jgi:predicted PurR-regulated permease PerM